MDRMTVFAVGLVIAGLLSGGIYQISDAGTGSYAVVNRFTGSTWFCAGNCRPQKYENPD
jgi:hypothetical protein